MRYSRCSVPLYLLLLGLIPACGASGQLGLEPVATGLTRALVVTAPAGDESRLFIMQQGGIIRAIEDDVLLGTPFLDISAIVDSSFNEEGLLGMVFHPDYFNNGLFYLNYTTTEGGIAQRIVQYSVLGDPVTSNVADPASEVLIVSLPKPFDNHNAGMLAFGPNDGMLYASTGDGGSANDPQDNGQNVNTLLGKVLRIDVDAGPPYVPADNPFVGVANHQELVWAYGLRNPWRFSFDRLTGDMFIGDVGQANWEEIDFEAADSAGGHNYGWKIAEGFECRGGGGTCGTDPGFTPPIHVFPTNVDGNSVVGGFVYRGSAIPTLEGTYFFGDSGFSRVWSFRYDAQTDTVSEFQERTAELEAGGENIANPAAFGEDGKGELYILNLNGTVYRITGPPPEVEPSFITASLPEGFIEEGTTLVLMAPGGSDYQWKKGGVDVTPDGDRLTGITSQDLVFDPVVQSDAGVYTCAFDNGAKVATETEPYTLDVLASGSLPVINTLFVLTAIVVLMTGSLSFIWQRR